MLDTIGAIWFPIMFPNIWPDAAGLWRVAVVLQRAGARERRHCCAARSRVTVS
jgi:hypothetical protein